MEQHFLVLALFGYAPIALLVFAPACAMLARRRNRDTETWLLLGASGGPIALAWILFLPPRPRPNQAATLLARRQRTPAQRIPLTAPVAWGRCMLCQRPLRASFHSCVPEEVEDRVQRRWTVRVGGQRVLGPP